MEYPMNCPTLVMIPCFSGAPWNLDQLVGLQDWPMRTMRLPDQFDDIEDLADFVLSEARELKSFVLVGDSFGAVISFGCGSQAARGIEGACHVWRICKEPDYVAPVESAG
jgi:surfactin synthase thioesterase subunit